MLEGFQMLILSRQDSNTSIVIQQQEVSQITVYIREARSHASKNTC